MIQLIYLILFNRSVFNANDLSGIYWIVTVALEIGVVEVPLLYYVFVVRKSGDSPSTLADVKNLEGVSRSRKSSK